MLSSVIVLVMYVVIPQLLLIRKDTLMLQVFICLYATYCLQFLPFNLLFTVSETHIHKIYLGQEVDFEGEPLLGVISMVLSVSISSDGNYLITSDRDEKIRISRYPQVVFLSWFSLNLIISKLFIVLRILVQAYVIESYCLGHTAYVGSVAVRDQRVFSSGIYSSLLMFLLCHEFYISLAVIFSRTFQICKTDK